MYSRDIFIERAQLAAIDVTVVFASLLTATFMRHGFGVFDPGTRGVAPFSAYLFPATIMATTWQPITIAADLARVNNYLAKVP